MADSEDERAADLLAAMLAVWAAEPSIEVRWQALGMLADAKKLLQGVTVRGLLPEDGSRTGVRAVARQLGITPGWVSQLADAADAAAGDRNLAPWGRALGVAGMLAGLADAPRSTRHRDSHADLVERDRNGEDVRAELEDAMSRWSMAARRQSHGKEANVLVERFAALLTRVTVTAARGWLDRVKLDLGYHQEMQAGRSSHRTSQAGPARWRDGPFLF